MRTIHRLLSVVLSVGSITLAGCAAQDRRDAPWDPRVQGQLFEQIPSWDGAANRVCCGHLRQCRPDQSPRC
jgi:hypothetical protein